MPRILKVVHASLAAVALTACGSSAPNGEGSATDTDSVQAAATWTRHVHLVQVLHPEPFVVPAGAACEFAVAIDTSAVANVNRFLNEAGERVSAIRQTAETNVLTNLTTGAVLREEIHYTLNVDFISGDQVMTGLTRQMRDADGKLVVQGAGHTLYAYDPETDNLVAVSSTPHDEPDWPVALCPALAEAPPPQ